MIQHGMAPKNPIVEPRAFTGKLIRDGEGWFRGFWTYSLNRTNRVRSRFRRPASGHMMVADLLVLVAVL